MISIRDAIHRYAATLNKTWQHDRSKTVGASEIGQCARKVYFDKHDAPRDPGYVDSWGARVRGNLIENEFWVPALRLCAQEDGVRLLYAGDDQETLISGYLSATTDGLPVWPDGSCINLDCKSIDSRISLTKAKPEHEFQVQVQMGLIRECTEHKPEISILSYINASFFDDVREYVIPWNPRAYKAAQARAEIIMTAPDALSLPPEGKMAGGSECDYCAWASHCAEVTVAGVPKDEQELNDDEAMMLHSMRSEYLAYVENLDIQKNIVAEQQERIKLFLRDHKTRRFKGSDWSVSYSTIPGRQTLDIAAVEAAGIDLKPFYKPGKPSERITIR